MVMLWMLDYKLEFMKNYLFTALLAEVSSIKAYLI